MTFHEYQERAATTAIYPNIGNNFVYPVLGLVGEAGEVAEKVKKIIRDEQGVISEEKRAAIKKELGDVLWYIAQTSKEFGLSLEDIAEFNLAKLASRKEQNILKGDGDNREEGR
ncbi:hypothetical protein FJZ48_03930 [Candidatus Uhrbacteria bacterium]|nr:hypothetical protein [Candidatus Uhrbacteria bacterium]